MMLEEYLSKVLARKLAAQSQLPDYTRTHAQVEAYKRGYAQAMDEVMKAITAFKRLEEEHEPNQITLL